MMQKYFTEYDKHLAGQEIPSSIEQVSFSSSKEPESDSDPETAVYSAHSQNLFL
jgi:hypothetical protein